MTDRISDTLTDQTMHVPANRARFPTTRWTLVIEAAGGTQAERRNALVSLCENYWYPLYAYIRRRGHSVDDARDLTQDFFMRILEGRYLDRADADKGRFRTFLLTSLKFYLADAGDRARAQKRRGAVLPFEIESGEERYRHEPSHGETPERIFERRWACSVVDGVLLRLQNEFVQQGRAGVFDKLKVFLLDRSEKSYSDYARELGMSEGALKVAIHRLRKRYRDLFRDEIAQTVPAVEVESELRYLAGALSEIRN